jgi:hypothetical protein
MIRRFVCIAATWIRDLSEKDPNAPRHHALRFVPREINPSSRTRTRLCVGHRSGGGGHYGRVEAMK